MTDQNVHVIIRQGDGLVARFGSGLLVLRPGGSEQVQQQLLDAMREACEGQELPGRMMARRLVGILSQAEPDDVPAFGACAPNERGWAVILHQGIALHVTRAHEMTTLSGYDASTWVDRIVEGGFESLTLLPDGEEVGVIDSRFRFSGGLVPGGGATVLTESGSSRASDQPAAPQPAAPQPVAQEPAVPQPVTPQPVAPQPAAPPPVAAQPVAAQPVAPQPPVAAQPVAPQAASIPPPAPVEPAPPVQPAAPVADAPSMADLDQEEEPPTLIQRPNRDVDSPGEPEQADEALPEDDIPFESVSLLDIGPEAKRDPLTILSEDTPKEDVEDEDSPLVYGVLSPNGYFNHPDALYCAVTGVSMLHRTHVLVQRPRPPLGVVVADDGSTFTLNTDYVVGREPERDPQVEADEARPLKLQDAERSLSRVHAKIRLVDWDVYVVDNSSANGTYVLPRGAQQWKRLVADTPEKIVPGTRIAFGKRVMTFESHHQINQAAAS